MLGHIYRFLTLAILLSLLPSIAGAQVFDERFDDWPVNLKIRGRTVLAGRLGDVSVLKQALSPRGKEERATVVVDPPAEGDGEKLIAAYRTMLAGYNDRLNVVTRSAEVAAGGAPKLAELLPACDLFCWHCANPMTEKVRESFLASQVVLANHLADGKTLALVGPQAGHCGQYCLAASGPQPGLNLVPDCVVRLEYDGSSMQRGELLSVLALHPRSVGVGIAPGTSLVLAGRQLQAVGTGKVTCLLMANEREPLRVQSIVAVSSPPADPEEHVIDLTQWRREAIERTSERFPPLEPEKPYVEHGTLVIVGGGGMPAGLMDRFIELAGGVEKARLVYVPCTELDSASADQGTVTAWRKQGVKHATSIHTKDRQQANGDAEFLRPLKEATGIWFGGGRQWNLSDSYYGTKAHAMMKEVLQRGGVIGGSSAGASIQARYLARATPIRNLQIMAPGYERGGLGFISGVAIDQHFTQRGRHKDMTQLMGRYPQLLGIGLDEATAIIVQKSIAEVTGRGQVHIFNRRLPVYPDRPDYLSLPAGRRYDLAARAELPKLDEPAKPPSAESSKSELKPEKP